MPRGAKSPSALPAFRQPLSQGHQGIAPARGVATRVVHGNVEDLDHVGEGASDPSNVSSHLGLVPTGSHAPYPFVDALREHQARRPAARPCQPCKTRRPPLRCCCHVACHAPPVACPSRRGMRFRFFAGKASPDSFPAGLAGFGPDQTGPHQCSNDSEQTFVIQSPRNKRIWA